MAHRGIALILEELPPTETTILRPIAVQQFLGLTRKQYANLRCDPTFPPAYKIIGAHIGHWKHEIEAWAATRKLPLDQPPAELVPATFRRMVEK